MGNCSMENSYKDNQNHAVSGIRLPHLLGEGCVLQRGERTRIWGWQEGGSRITALFQGNTYEAGVQPDGRFELFLKDVRAGGPFVLELYGDGGAHVIRKEVYAGDVFVCAGQSNMELPMERVKERYPEEFFCPGNSGGAGECGKAHVAESWMLAYELFTGMPVKMRGNAQVHVYKVPECASFACEKDDHENAAWVSCTGNGLAEVSAFSYFFGCFLNHAHKVPAGIINISRGGTPVEAWTGEEGLAAHPELIKIKKRLEDDACLQEVCRQQEAAAAAWEQQLQKKEQAHWQELQERELAGGPGPEWKQLQVPGYFAEQGLEGYCGVLWLKRTFQAEKEDAAQRALLRLGTLNGADRTYINGRFAGETGYSYPPRRYELSEGMLKEGENEIRIRLVCGSLQGRATPGKPYEIVMASGKKIDLKGTWQYQAKGCCGPAPEWDPVIRRPSGLFQGMTAPCLPASVKGVIWYQGESNDRGPDAYESLLKGMIQNWRSRWGQEKLPFVVVQLPACGVDTAGGGAWAKIRQAQQQAAQLPDVAVTVNLDLGEYYDLHPLNKKDAARRAFLAAEHLVYGKDVVWQGPQLCGYEKQQDSLLLQFDTKDGKGLCVWNGTQPQQFEAAGSDGAFFPVPAIVQKDAVRLLLKETQLKDAKNVQAVRYAWKDAPLHGLLCSQAGLYTGPFWIRV